MVGLHPFVTRAATIAGLATVTVAVSELAAWHTSRRVRPAARHEQTAILVLGFPSGRGHRVHPVQAWRAKVAARTLARLDEGWLIFTGGVTGRATVSEAEVMARYAIDVLGVPADRVRVEPEARSTWENVHRSWPIVAATGATHVAMASDPFHAARARWYLRVQQPDAPVVVVAADDFVPFEAAWAKPIMLAVALSRIPTRWRERRTHSATRPTTHSGPP